MECRIRCCWLRIIVLGKIFEKFHKPNSITWSWAPFLVERWTLLMSGLGFRRTDLLGYSIRSYELHPTCDLVVYLSDVTFAEMG